MNIDFHVHTNYSYDGYLPLDKLDEVCSGRKITAVAITDHNETEGALEGAKVLGAGKFKTRVIVGEEVQTAQGEIIGLFLKRRIPPGMSLAETIEAIRDQGGLVYLNHPFGYGRRSAKLSLAELDGLWDKIDIVEIFNGRNWNQQANDLAKELALARGKPGGVGTDAHSPWEVGRSYVSMLDFDGPETFLASLRKATYVCRPCPFAYRLLFKARKLLLQRPLPRG
jgi:predicted metal-dependent phosphoesterase TrpH